MTIKKITLSAFGILAFVLIAYASTIKSWQIDESHSSVNFTTTHFFTEVNGNFKEFNGTIQFDPDNLEESSATFSIPVSSVNTGNEKRDKHLLTEDFFDEKRFPKISFVSSKFVKKDDGTYAVLGELTIRDQTKTVGLPFRVTGKMEHPFIKNTEIMGISLKTRINRSNFKVGTGTWAETAVVGDEVLININMELMRRI